MREFVITGISFFEGGPLSVFYDCIEALISNKYICGNYKIVAFVHSKALFQKYTESNIEFIELPKSRNSYIHRCYYEYVFFKHYSEQHDVEVWLSLHDMTPNVKADRIYTYCHSVSPFIRNKLKGIKYGLKTVVHSLFYKYIYRKQQQ